MGGADRQFAERVYAIVAQIPRGRVMTYGQIAGLCGNARAARIVGGIAHFGPPDLPWQRVVNKKGGLAAGFYGGRNGHKSALEAEGVTVHGTVVNKKGGLAAGFYGGRNGHKSALEAEGVTVHGTEDNYYIDIDRLIWNPNS